MAKSKWTLDPTHAEIQFKIRHMMISWVTGSFKQFNAEVETDGDDFTTAVVNFTAQVNSISTNNEQRDGHLKNGDFFDAETYPEIKFKSTELQRIDEENYQLEGVLTVRGISKPVVLKADFGGIIQDPWGNIRTGFTIDGKINRKDFGISFSMVSETGGILLGEDVTIHANVEFVKAVVPAAVAA